MNRRCVLAVVVVVTTTAAAAAAAASRTAAISSLGTSSTTWASGLCCPQVREVRRAPRADKRAERSRLEGGTRDPKRPRSRGRR